MKKYIEEKSYVTIHDLLLYFASLTTSITVLMGFFLSMEEGYSSDLLILHKWTGVGLSFFMYMLIISAPGGIVYKSISYLSVVCIVFTGHLGASITHGNDFLLEPVMVKKIMIDENSTVYETVIQPIFESKCIGCHNPDKQKGELDMTTWEGIQKGGENGQIWEAGNSEESDFIQRIMLDIKHDDHMPPDGKPQLTSFETKILKNWINEGASNIYKLADYDEADTTFQLASLRYKEMLDAKTQKSYDFREADKDLIESLNTPFRTVRQNTITSPALDVNIYVKEAFSPEFVSELSPISTQIVNLNLSYMPIKESELLEVRKFENLEKLYLNYTETTNEGIAHLAGLEHLEILALAGTAVTIESLDIFSSFPSLKTVYLLETALNETDISELQNSFPGIQFDPGYIPDKDLTLVISPPILGNETNILGKDDKIELKHSIPDTRIFYTIDGSDPDSSSIQYDQPFSPEKISPIKAIAYKDGWQPSTVAEF